MNKKHITEILDNSPLRGLSPGDLELVKSHSNECESARAPTRPLDSQP